jgi:hypothetical protein
LEEIEGQNFTAAGKKLGVNKRGCMSIPTGQGYIPLHAYNFSVTVHGYILSYAGLYRNLKAIPLEEYKVHSVIEVTSV